MCNSCGTVALFLYLALMTLACSICNCSPLVTQFILFYINALGSLVRLKNLHTLYQSQNGRTYGVNELNKWPFRHCILYSKIRSFWTSPVWINIVLFFSFINTISYQRIFLVAGYKQKNIQEIEKRNELKTFINNRSLISSNKQVSFHL